MSASAQLIFHATYLCVRVIACACAFLCVHQYYVSSNQDINISKQDYIKLFSSLLGDKKPTICLDFNDKQQPFKNSQGFYVSWSKYNTATVLDNGVEGTALRFNGDRLEIPAYNNKVRKRTEIK